MTLHDWFAGLLSTGQWLVIFIVLGMVCAGVFIYFDAKSENPGGPAIFGLLVPFFTWGLIMVILHFVDWLIALWNWDYVMVSR